MRPDGHFSWARPGHAHGPDAQTGTGQSLAHVPLDANRAGRDELARVGVVLHGSSGVSFPFAGVAVVFGSLSEVVEDVASEVGVDGVGVA